jgi:hypothetical protein
MSEHYLVDVCEPLVNATRSVRITGKAIRIGRSAICEVQLRGGRLAAIECMLRYDGENWSLTPFASAGQVSMGGAALVRAMQVAPDQPIQVGEFELRVRKIDPRQTEAADGTRASPLSAEARPRAVRRQAPSVARIDNTLRERTEKAVLAPRANWGTAPIPASAPPSLPVATVKHARGVSAVPYQKLQPGLEAPAAVDHYWSKILRPQASGKLGAPKRVSSLPETALTIETETVCEPREPGILPEWLDADELACRDAWDQSDSQAASNSELPGTVKPGLNELLVDHDFELPEDERPIVLKPSVEQDGTSDRVATDLVAEDEIEPSSTDTPQSDFPPRLRSHSREPVLLSNEEQSAWPSTRAMIQSYEHVKQRTSVREGEARRLRPTLTEPVQPAAWTIGNRLALGLALLVVTLGFAASVMFSAAWSEVGRIDGLLVRALLNGDAPGADLRESLSREPFWATSAEHLYRRSWAISPDSADPANQTDAWSLLHRAHAHAPLNMTVNYTLAVLNQNPSTLIPALQPAHDVVSLTESARLRFALGQSERARQDLRDAFELASTAQIDQAEPPRFETAPDIRRARLPNEDLFAPIITVILEQGGMRELPMIEQVIPEYGPAWLALYREVRVRDTGNATAILRHLTQLSPIAPDAASGFLHRAAIAEGFAFDGDFTASANGYLQAIKLSMASPWHGLLLVNLSDIYARQFDQSRSKSTRQLARKYARGGTPAALALKRILDSVPEDLARSPRT